MAHPGLITPQEARLAAEKGVFLEISGRRGHSFTNGHVARIATEMGARLVLNSDSHAPGDFMPRAFAKKVVEGAGLPQDAFEDLLSNSRLLLEKSGYPLQ